MVSAERIQTGFTGVGVAGIACIGAAAAKVTPCVGLEACVGVVLAVAGLAKKKTRRSDGKCDMKNQTKFVKDTGVFMDATDEDGKPMKVYCGEKGVLGLPLTTEGTAGLGSVGGVFGWL